MVMKLETMLKRTSESTGIPLALFIDKSSVFEFNNFTPNPAFAVIESLGLKEDGVYYTITPDYLFYGCVRLGNKVVAAGPVSTYKVTQHQIRSILQLLKQSMSRENEMMRWLHTLPTCRIKRFRETLSLIAYLLDESMDGSAVPVSCPLSDFSKTVTSQDLSFINKIDDATENLVIMAVESGNPAELDRLLRMYDENGEEFLVLSDNVIRSFKNTFIMAVSIVSRAAMRGGLDYTTAVTVREKYLAQIEEMNQYQEIKRLILIMFFDYARRTEKTQKLPADSAVVARVCKYVQSHLHERILATDISENLHINNAYLCRHFKQKTGKALSEYITERKVQEAKRLLEYTDFSLVEISACLGFTSQQYFHTVFKKYGGITPKEYRNKYIH